MVRTKVGEAGGKKRLRRRLHLTRASAYSRPSGHCRALLASLLHHQTPSHSSPCGSRDRNTSSDPRLIVSSSRSSSELRWSAGVVEAFSDVKDDGARPSGGRDRLDDALEASALFLFPSIAQRINIFSRLAVPIKSLSVLSVSRIEDIINLHNRHLTVHQDDIRPRILLTRRLRIVFSAICWLMALSSTTRTFVARRSASLSSSVSSFDREMVSAAPLEDDSPRLWAGNPGVTGTIRDGLDGIQKVAFVPTPSFDSNEILPCMSSTRFLLMVSPSPVPPNRRAVELSAWENGLKSRLRTSSSIPMPGDAAIGSEFDRIREQIRHHLAQSARVAHDFPILELLDIIDIAEPLALSGKT
ncbi:hypothetical protein KC349_g328 [Hortaea werneckii]|nr:hypothetical protein KC349_g328 [Hortaea werneckii]